MIFITETDILGDNLPLYHIERMISETGKIFDDGSHILYLNTAYKGSGNSKAEKLISDFLTVSPENIQSKNLKRRFYDLKVNPMKKEEDTMCELLEQLIKSERDESAAEGRAEGRAAGKEESSNEIAREMLLSGEVPVEKIARFCRLTIEQVLAIKKSIA